MNETYVKNLQEAINLLPNKRHWNKYDTVEREFNNRLRKSYEAQIELYRQWIGRLNCI